ncbi:MAG: hypothetical protein M3Q78_06625 [Acidobacteriota bacterium]|nr:hypothetical protein [Acidobacteriota bacterium]
MKRLASAESLSEWGGNTVLFNDDVGDITVKVQARLPKFRRKKADGRRNRRKKPSKSVGMDKKNRRSILRIVENKQELVADSEKLNSESD